ncbi:MAG: zinc-binding alcohol dehydrogenase [Pseudomonadales bacterium]|jgi:threonine dehydrogenase-like Zn-dependent dehydrogenase|nr:zinc-binding alcohol dehydrogenase [Pseudomonadales bacterium]
MSVRAQQLWFTAPHTVAVREVLLEPAANEVLVQVSCSAPSAGTELLVYRGQLPEALALDSSLPVLQEQNGYPLRYGYASVGRVIACGACVDASWLGRRVFAFQPHASHYLAEPSTLIPLPATVSDEAAVFLANMETAVNLVHDGAPLLGERVAVLGLGIVGLLTSALLAQFPLAALYGIDPQPQRRASAQALGVMSTHDVSTAPERAALAAALAAQGGVDLLFELSGEPQALALALDLSGYCSRIVVGSWYGNKSCALPLGGAVHRNRVSIVTSQVSTLAPALAGRWSKARRFDTTWAQLQRVQPERWIDLRVPLTQAPELYQRLHERHAAPLQALFIY